MSARHPCFSQRAGYDEDEGGEEEEDDDDEDDDEEDDECEDEDDADEDAGEDDDDECDEGDDDDDDDEEGDDEGGSILFGSKKIHPTAKELSLLKQMEKVLASHKKAAKGDAAASKVKGSKSGEASAPQSASKKGGSGGGASDLLSVDHELRVRSGLLAVLLSRPDIDAVGRAHDLLVRGVQAAVMVAKACGTRRPVPVESLLLLDLVLLGGPTALYSSLSGVAKQAATVFPTIPSHLTPYDIPLAVLFSVRHSRG